jgi:hypothetical protein
MPKAIIPVKLRYLLLALAAILLAGCAATTLKSNRNPAYAGGPFKKLAVFVLAKDDSVRRFAEDQMVQRLPAGTVGVPGYTLFPKVTEGDKDAIRDRLVAAGFDGAMVTRLVSVDRSQMQVPGQTFVATGMVGGAPYYPTVGGYYGYAAGYGGHGSGSSSYTVDVTTVLIETVAYKLPDDLWVWSGTTQAFDPRSKAELAQTVAELVDEGLTKQGLVGGAAR